MSHAPPFKNYNVGPLVGLTTNVRMPLYMALPFKIATLDLTFRNWNIEPTFIRFTIWAQLYSIYNVGPLQVDSSFILL